MVYLSRAELEAFLDGESGEDLASKLKVKGCPFQKSFTIYRGNAIVAQAQIIDKCLLALQTEASMIHFCFMFCVLSLTSNLAVP